jgi:hypothetical protein
MYRVNASAPCSVFVLFQQSAMPTWIAADGWSNTGLSLLSDGSNYAIYSKVFPAGDIDLKRQMDGSTQGIGYVFKLATGEPTVEANANQMNPSSLRIRVVPNPFSPSTNLIIHQSSASSRSVRSIRCQVFDINGKMVKDFKKAGAEAAPLYIPWDASGEPAGIYMVKVRAGSQVLHKSAMLLK